jgi:hypothetical protein
MPRALHLGEESLLRGNDVGGQLSRGINPLISEGANSSEG